MRKNLLPLAPALLAMSLLLAACGGSARADDADLAGASDAAPAAVIYETETEIEPTEDPAPAAEPSLTACELFDADAIAGAYDIAIDEVVEGELELTPTVLSPGNSECRYEGDAWQLLIDLTPDDGPNLYDAARGAYDDAIELDADVDGAFWSPKTRRMFVWKGSATAMVTIGTDGDKQAVAHALAEAFAAR